MQSLKFDKKRFRVKFCPCGKTNKDGKFVPYECYENKGYCHSCGETFLPGFTPTDDWNSEGITPYVRTKANAKSNKPFSSIHVAILKDSLVEHESNYFIRYLLSLFSAKVTSDLISSYFIGSSQKWTRSTVFWQIDSTGAIRGGKVVLYNPENGKRVREPFDHVSWIHTLQNLPDFSLRQCLFGEHLLRLPQSRMKCVAIVESEKTAIIASAYLPQFIWLAAGSKDGLNADKCRVLTGRTVILFPDLNAFEIWNDKANEFKEIATFIVSDLLERKASDEERKDKLDLADYLVRFPIHSFRDGASDIGLPTTQISVNVNIPSSENVTIIDLIPEADPMLSLRPSSPAPFADLSISTYEMELIKRVYFWMGCDLLSLYELINGIVYEMERHFPIRERLEPHSEEDNGKAKELIQRAEEACILFRFSMHFELTNVLKNNDIATRTNEVLLGHRKQVEF